MMDEAGADRIRQTLERLLKDEPNRLFVLRDTGDTAYPRIDDPAVEPPKRSNRWRIRRVANYDGKSLTMVLASHHAWLDEATGRWDQADAWNLVVLRPEDDPWNGAVAPEAAVRIEAKAHAAGPNRAIVQTLGTIPVAWVARIDEQGDGLSRFSQLFVNPAPDTGYAYDSIVGTIALVSGGESRALNPADRVRWFDGADRVAG